MRNHEWLTEFVVKVNRHSRGSGIQEVAVTDDWIPARASLGRNDEPGVGHRRGRITAKDSHNVDGLSLLPVSSLVRNHSQDFIREGGIDNG